MDTLTETQRQEYATSFAALALYDGEAEISQSGIQTLLDATNNTVESYYPIIFAGFLTAEKITELINSPGGSGGGGGAAAGGDAAAEEAAPEAVVEEEEIDMGGGLDMFGGEPGGGGDY